MKLYLVNSKNILNKELNHIYFDGHDMEVLNFDTKHIKDYARDLSGNEFIIYDMKFIDSNSIVPYDNILIFANTLMQYTTHLTEISYITNNIYILAHPITDDTVNEYIDYVFSNIFDNDESFEGSWDDIKDVVRDVLRQDVYNDIVKDSISLYDLLCNMESKNYNKWIQNKLYIAEDAVIDMCGEYFHDYVNEDELTSDYPSSYFDENKVYILAKYNDGKIFRGLIDNYWYSDINNVCIVVKPNEHDTEYIYSDLSAFHEMMNNMDDTDKNDSKVGYNTQYMYNENDKMNDNPIGEYILVRKNQMYDAYNKLGIDDDSIEDIDASKQCLESIANNELSEYSLIDTDRYNRRYSIINSQYSSNKDSRKYYIVIEDDVNTDKYYAVFCPESFDMGFYEVYMGYKEYATVTASKMYRIDSNGNREELTKWEDTEFFIVNNETSTEEVKKKYNDGLDRNDKRQLRLFR